MDGRFTYANVSRLLAKAWLRFLPIGVGLAVILGSKSFSELTGISMLLLFTIGVVIFGAGCPPAYERWATRQFGEALSVDRQTPSHTVRWWQFAWIPAFLVFYGVAFAIFAYGVLPLAKFAMTQAGMDAPNSRSLAVQMTAIIGWPFLGVVLRASDIVVAWLERDR